MKLRPTAVAMAFPKEALLKPVSTTHALMAAAVAEQTRTHRVQVQPSARRLGRSTARMLLAKTGAAATFNSHLTTARLKVWSMVHGADATQLLAMLMVVIGTPCECGARQFGHEPAWVRQLHGALRAIRDMCAAGYRWDEACVPMLDRAVELASATRPEMDPETFVDAYLEASAAANEIEAHRFTFEQIA